jgi:hypothetical protein
LVSASPTSAADPGTHGNGTIVGYKGRRPDTYAQTSLKEAIEFAVQTDNSIKPMMLDVIANSFYYGTRCPYILQWDPREKYPNGYKEMYERDSIDPITV